MPNWWFLNMQLDVVSADVFLALKSDALDRLSRVAKNVINESQSILFGFSNSPRRNLRTCTCTGVPRKCYSRNMNSLSFTETFSRLKWIDLWNSLAFKLGLSWWIRTKAMARHSTVILDLSNSQWRAFTVFRVSRATWSSIQSRGGYRSHADWQQSSITFQRSRDDYQFTNISPKSNCRRSLWSILFRAEHQCMLDSFQSSIWSRKCIQNCKIEP